MQLFKKLDIGFLEIGDYLGNSLFLMLNLISIFGRLYIFLLVWNLLDNKFKGGAQTLHPSLLYELGRNIDPCASILMEPIESFWLFEIHSPIFFFNA